MALGRSYLPSGAVSAQDSEKHPWLVPAALLWPFRSRFLTLLTGGGATDP